jgi:photosynthetic reaction center cytochrome c subunit
MRFGLPLALIASSIAVASAQSPAPAPSPAAAAAPAATPSGAPAYAAENEKYLTALQASIKGKEDLPAKEVFKNLKTLGDVPATRLLRTMQAFTRSLGTKCTHCHVAEQWDSEDKEEKQVARDMMAMTRAINEEYLKKIKALEADKPSVNCFLCHRGHAHAGEELRPPPAASPAPAR